MIRKETYKSSVESIHLQKQGYLLFLGIDFAEDIERMFLVTQLLFASQSGRSFAGHSAGSGRKYPV